MTIKEHPFDPEAVLNTGLLFPDDISNDTWIYYHGTSSIFENAIETNGFKRSQSEFLCDREVRGVVSIFEKMQWCGSDLGGFAVLKPFSLNFDLKDGSSPIFFGESGYRALLYATSDFAGGEKARALRKSIKDLEYYITSKAIRDEHIADLENEYNELARCGAQLGTPPSMVDLEWLSIQLSTLDMIKRKCEQYYDDHKYGLVYAIKFTQNESSHLAYNRSMGLLSFSDIPLDRIIAKVKVPREFTYRSRADSIRMQKLLIGVTRFRLHP